MEGFRCFQETMSLWIPQSPLPGTHAKCGSGSSSRSPIGATHFDQTLEAAFSGLNVSSFSPQSRFACDRSNGSVLKNTVNVFDGEHLMPFFNDESQSLSLQNGENGVLWNVGLEDCWVDCDSGLSNGNLSNFSVDCFSMAYLRGRVAFLAKDQEGCRFLQKAMDCVSNKELTDLIFMELLEDVAPLMLDPYGNYVVQRLVEVCSEEQRTQLLLMLTNKRDLQLICISLDNRGTRSIQKLLKHVTTKQQISLIMRALSPNAVALSKNINGQHIIQNCLEHFSDEDNEYLLRVVADNCVGIAKDKVGCCVLQKCVDHSHGEIREHMVAKIVSNAIVLAVDHYGNYVVQHLLGLKTPQIAGNLHRQLQGSYMSLSCNKYGSNVVEKCLLESGEEQSTEIIFELVTNANVSMLLLHPFGNYVIQTALTVSKGIYHTALLDLVDLYSPTLRGNYYGKKVLAWRSRSLRHM